MTRSQLLAFLRSHHYAVQSTVSADGQPQSAIVGIAVADGFDIVFDTLKSSRKAVNLLRDNRIAFVIGDVDPAAAKTVQIEGRVDRPEGQERDRLVALYLARFPTGTDRLAWPGLVYFRTRPTWLRYADYTQTPPLIVEWDAEALARLR